MAARKCNTECIFVRALPPIFSNMATQLRMDTMQLKVGTGQLRMDAV